MASSSGVTFVLFCFVFVYDMFSLKLRPFVQSSFDMQAPRYPHVFLSFFPFCLFGDVAFSGGFFISAFSLLLLLLLFLGSSSH